MDVDNEARPYSNYENMGRRRLETASDELNEVSRTIPIRFEQLGDVISTIDTQVDMLIRRISPILRPSDSVKGDSAAQPTSAQGDLANEITNKIEWLQRISDSLRVTLADLELP